MQNKESTVNMIVLQVAKCIHIFTLISVFQNNIIIVFCHPVFDECLPLRSVIDVKLLLKKLLYNYEICRRIILLIQGDKSGENKIV